MSQKEFENKWLNQITSGLLKNFPEDFISNLEYEILNLPEKSISKGSEILGVYEIIDRDGKTFYQSENLSEIKYILYSNRNNSKKLKFLKDKSALDKIVHEYEKHIDGILKSIESDYKNVFPGSKDFVYVSNRIFKFANLVRY